MPTPDQAPAQARVDQAIDWLVRLRFGSPGPDAQAQFQQWLSLHPHNGLAWQRVSNLGDELAGLPKDLSRRTLQGSKRQGISRRDQLKLGALLVVGSGLGWMAREPLGLPELLADSATATGERRQLQGSDGSRIQLNTASAIDLRFTASQRRLALLRGEVSLDSNSDDRRPFFIDTRIAILRTLDGQLLVRQSDHGLLVAVRRGEVTVMTGATPVRVHSGETLRVQANGSHQAVTPPSDPWGWTQGVLSVRQMPLADFVAELNRYRPGLLRCAPAVAKLMVSGTYQLADTNQILQLLARSLPVRIDYHTQYWVNIDAA
ncbi:FecR domain-containing protein [Pseudomonas putida]|uniref:FecR domain-containing protein n=1 Tax=Pseudomonas putida TaxID=303 RepID=UPI0018AC547D|nr:FecR domain-containing protein [Pseudomonas putida]MBF8766832.1 FecR domain-containing protein [Pseudomonas putida]